MENISTTSGEQPEVILARGLNAGALTLPEILSFRPEIPELQFAPGRCPNCGSFFYESRRAERKHHDNLHAIEAELADIYPGLVCNQRAREELKTPEHDPKTHDEWANYALTVLFCLFSREVVQKHLQIEPPKLVCMSNPHPQWEIWIEHRLNAERDGRIPRTSWQRLRWGLSKEIRSRVLPTTRSNGRGA